MCPFDVRALPRSYAQVPEISDNFSSLCHHHLAYLPGFVDFRSVEKTRKDLADVEAGRAFWLQIGPCHEDIFSGVGEAVALWRMVREMLPSLEAMVGRRVVPVLRAAGQSVKPRSNDHETQGELTLMSFRGHMLHDFAFTRHARSLEPRRVLQAYRHAQKVSEALNLEKDFKRIGALSHEALLLHYEAALLARHEGQLYSQGGNLLWIGNRTNQPDGTHAKFLAPIYNPIGIKVGGSMLDSQLIQLIERLNPENEHGKILLISRMGVESPNVHLERLAKAVLNRGLHVSWVVDPMHGNAEKTLRGHKTRRLENILKEAVDFIRTLMRLGVNVGGIHLEAGEGSFQECLPLGVGDKVLGSAFQSLCDPRLNGEQTRYLVEAYGREFARMSCKVG